MADWSNVEWHTPGGTIVHIYAEDMPCAVRVVFTDGTTRDLMLSLNGREISHVEIDGERYTRERKAAAMARRIWEKAGL